MHLRQGSKVSMLSRCWLAPPCHVCYTVEAIEKILPLREAELVMIAKTSISKDTSDNAVIIQPLYKH